MTYEELVLWLKAFIHDDEKDIPEQCNVNINDVISNSYQSEDALFASL